MNRSEGRFPGNKGLSIYYQCWLPSEKPKAVLVYSHGLAEHGGRNMNMVNYFVSRGYAVYSLDHRGHGISEGTKGYVDSFSDFTADLDAFLSLVHDEHPDSKIFLVGHSVGGTIATAYALNYQDKIDGLILSAPTITAGESVSPALILLARILSRLTPHLGLYTIDSSALCRDSSVIDEYVSDPLVYRGKIQVRLGMEILRAMKALKEQLPEITLPALIMHGTDDRLSEPEGSRILYEKLGSTDITYREYEGFYHEIFNEPDRDRPFADMETWLNARI